ncbi:MAG TPA: CopG family transcriptional regulator [Burkholderiaceae bacterium]|jgi:predicted transcriptional regulator|nr:CopG family transcriptional regulator [Burkholderiaceae bacterium]
MSTTTIRLPDELKARVAKAAAAAGVSPHGFIVEAVAARAAEVEARQAFEALARQRLEEFERSGKAIALADMRSYMQDKASGRATTRPKARKVVL